MPETQNDTKQSPHEEIHYGILLNNVQNEHVSYTLDRIALYINNVIDNSLPVGDIHKGLRSFSGTEQDFLRRTQEKANSRAGLSSSDAKILHDMIIKK